jgi:hypothetical protein
VITSKDYRCRLPSPDQLLILSALQKHGLLSGVDLFNMDIPTKRGGSVYAHISKLKKRKLIEQVGLRSPWDGNKKLTITQRGELLLEVVSVVEKILY